MVEKGTTAILLILFGICFSLPAQTTIVRAADMPDTFCISEAEWKLVKMINEYRKQYDLPPIPASRSLCFVANTHVKDLYFHHPDIDPCNFHSWSDKGPWKPFCYPRDEDKNNSVWDKPKELSAYPAKGYEIVYWENHPVEIDSVFLFWRSFDYFNSFLTNTGRWKDKSWNAIGIGIFENYASAWFGEAPDPEGIPYICGQPPPGPASGKGTTDSIQTDFRKMAPKPVAPREAPVAIPGHYHIIVKSQLPIKEAEKLVQQLSNRGYLQARILPSGETFRVSLFHTGDRAEALRYLKEARTIYPDAWLLKQ